MGTPLYNTDIIPLTSRPTLTVMDDGDYFVILDTSTGKISKILKTNIMTALKISYDNTTSELTAETVQAALDELVVNLGSLEGAGHTNETVKGNADAIALRELLSNKKTTLADNSDTYFPTQKAVNDGLATKITRPTSTDKAIPRFSGTSGDLQNSGVTIDDSGNITPAGIYLGGASTANLLDDYEEGTWTPTLEASTTNPTVSEYVTRIGRYTKIGNTVIVHCHVRATLSNIGSGDPRVTGLPFLAVSDLPGISPGLKTIIDNYNNSDTRIVNQEVLFRSASYNLNNSAYITFSAVYRTNL